MWTFIAQTTPDYYFILYSSELTEFFREDAVLLALNSLDGVSRLGVTGEVLSGGSPTGRLGRRPFKTGRPANSKFFGASRVAVSELPDSLKT